VIDAYVRQLDRALNGPGRIKADLLREVRDGLEDAATAYDDEARALAEFGAVSDVAPAFQAELAASATRSVAMRVVAAFGVGAFAANLMWQGAPWTGAPPPGGFQVLSQIMDVTGNGLAVLGALGMAALWLRARAAGGVPLPVLRIANRAAAVLLTFTWAVGITMLVWSALLWSTALSWPPMVAGTAAITAASIWIARAVRTGLGATRIRPELAG
jgi:hypothetical protein